MRPFFFFRYSSKMCRTPNLAACLQDACVCVCLCLCECVEQRFRTYRDESRVRMASIFLTVCLGFLQKASARDSWRQRQSMCSRISPSNPSMRECVKHPDLSCRYQNRVRIIYTLCTVVCLIFPPPRVLVPLQVHNDKLSFQAVHRFATSKSRYLHDESPQKCSAHYVSHLHDGFIDGNAC